jgi:hypothetical protein
MRSDRQQASLTQTTHKTDILYSEGFKILTIVNGRIVNCEVRNRSRPEEKATSIPGNKFLKSSHTVLIIGDSHLKGSAAGTNQFLNMKFSVCNNLGKLLTSHYETISTPTSIAGMVYTRGLQRVASGALCRGPPAVLKK